MVDEISPELFDRLVELAALELESDEKGYLRAQLNNQLKAIKELLAIPIAEDIPIAAHGVSYSAEMRASLRNDDLLPFGAPKKILDQAPEVDEGYIIVPEIPHKDLD